MIVIIETLERLERINRAIGAAANETDPNGDRVLALRGDFSFECNQLLHRLTGLVNVHHQASLASRLQDEFLSMFRLLIEHQQCWSAARIANEPKAYADASHMINGRVLGFVERSLEAITNYQVSARAA